MGSILKIIPAILLISTAATSFDPGGLEYQSETFSLVIGADGSGELSVLYKNFGSKEERGSQRKKDLSYLKDSVMSGKMVAESADEGVEILERRLDFDNFMLHAFVKAKSKAYGKIFQVFTHYTLEIEDQIYITPLNGVVGQADVGGGKVVIRNNRYAFAWPTDTKKLEFTAVYKVTGVSFSSELSKR